MSEEKNKGGSPPPPPPKPKPPADPKEVVKLRPVQANPKPPDIRS
jgi:hypothetical protein